MPSGQTHQVGRVLDAVAVTGFDVTAAADMSVKVVDVGISDYYMLKWRVSIRRLLLVVLWCVPAAMALPRRGRFPDCRFEFGIVHS